MTDNKRSIKFRAWDKRRKKMIFGPTDENVNSAWVFTMAEVGGVYDDVLVLMQSTGLLDKNKKEIYEGDIVKDGNLIKFESGCFWLYKKDRTSMLQASPAGCYPLYRIDTESFLEVIGNIYENPELLKL